MAKTQQVQQVQATWGIATHGRLDVERRGDDVVSLTMPGGFVMTLMVDEARTLAARLTEECSHSAVIRRE
ncbi:hypothetical protein ACXR2U_04845 [Jatrophihabitans sp. YIM 134969]